MLVELIKKDTLSPNLAEVVPIPGRRPPHHQVLLALDSTGHAVGYWNVCKHIPVPLDGGVGHLPVVSQTISCTTHGAEFQLDGGLCISGPCRGKLLDPVQIREKEGVLYAVLEEL